MNILIITIESSRIVGTTRDHLDSFLKYSQNLIIQMDISAIKTSKFDFSLFDCIVIHYSVPIGYGTYIDKNLVQKFSKYKGLLALFIQDEMRWVDSTVSNIKALGISLIFTVTNKEVTRKIYHDPYFNTVRFEHVLTGYVPEHLLEVEVPAYNDRTIDVSYRARKLPAWYGEFGQEKSLIAERFLHNASTFNLNCDISCAEQDRIYGDHWIKFLAGSKATLGAESGASFIDFSGQIWSTVEEYEMRYPEKTFAEIRDLFLEGRDGEIVIQVISPRCFEAAALRTLMIMYEGLYSDVLIPHHHYVVLERDHSNIEDIIKLLNNPAQVSKIIENAYREIACSEKWSYKSMIKKFDIAIDEEWTRKKLRKTKPIPAKKIELIYSIQNKYKYTPWKIKFVIWLSNKQKAVLSYIGKLPYKSTRVFCITILRLLIWLPRKIITWVL